MNIFNNFKEKIVKDLEKIFGKIENAENISIEYPKNPSHGDISTNAAMILTKFLKKSPSEIALVMIDFLKKYEEVESCEIAGAGFINIKLKADFWHNILASILQDDKNYGKSNIGRNKKVNIEFVSVNPTGPMHVGHSRGAVYGDVLSELHVFCGYEVTREYYVNDAGSQINILASSAYLRYKEAAGEFIGEIPSGLYPGDYLKDFGKYLYENYQNQILLLEETEAIEKIKPLVVEYILNIIKNDLASLGVKHDLFFSEKTLHDNNKITEVISLLKKRDLLYYGVLAPPKGKLPDDWESREQLLFKSVLFGDDIDRSLQKSDGSFTYFAADVAYAQDKISRGFDKIIFALGADHAGYIKRMQAVIKALSEDKIESKILITQLVNFLKNGEILKMSKRSGNFIAVQDVIELVGKDVF